MKFLGRRATIAIAAVACLAVVAGGWFLLISPTRSSISKTKAQTAQQVQDNQSAQLQLQSMGSIAKHLPAEQAELAVLQQRVPSQVQLSALLRSIQSLAASSGVKLLGIAPTVPSPLPNAPGISTVGVTLNVSGGYAEIEQFDSALEGLKRTFLVSGFSMTGGASAASASSSSSSSSSSPYGSATTINASFSGRVLVKTPATAGTTSGKTASSTTATSGH